MELKPCPFCGASSNKILITEGSTFRWLKLECGECGASCGEVRKTGKTSQENMDIVSKEWNTRA